MRNKIDKIEDKEVEYIIEKVMDNISITCRGIIINDLLRSQLVKTIKEFVNAEQRDEICPECFSLIDDERFITGIGGMPDEIVTVGYKCECGYEEDY